MLWALKKTQDRLVDNYDTKHKKIHSNESPIQVELVGHSLEKSNGGVAKALEFLEQGESAHLATNEW